MTLVEATTGSSNNIMQSAARTLQLLHNKTSKMYNLEVERANGLPITVTCTSNATKVAETDRRGVIVEFDYEFTILNPKEELAEVMKQDLPALEFFLLYFVAEETGLLECDMERQAIPPLPDDGTNGASSTTSTVNGVTVLNVDVISLSSTSTDTRDWTVASCEYLVDIDPSFICIPLKGTMKATYLGTAADYDAVTAFLSSNIEQVINSAKIRESGVEQAIYLGSRSIPTPVAPISLNGSFREVDNNFGNRSVALVSGFSVAAVFFMFVIYFAIARRRRQKANSEIEIVPPIAETDKQICLSVGDSCDDDSRSTPPVVVAMTKSLLSGDFDDDDASDKALVGNDLESALHLGQQPPDKEVPSSSTPYPMSSAYSITTSRTASTTKDSFSDSTSTFDDEQTEKVANLTPVNDDVEVPTSAPPPVIDVLPPKHPTGPSLKPPTLPVGASKSTTKRRKKKKKKKQALIRSASRENVSEMETINEGEEETSDNKDEEGSEYSWCSTSDSDPGSNPGSRDPSPARSHGSREASPARSSSGSDGGNVGASSVSWDSTFIGLAAASSSDSDSTGKPNKPYRLPPKWI